MLAADVLGSDKSIIWKRYNRRNSLRYPLDIRQIAKPKTVSEVLLVRLLYCILILSKHCLWSLSSTIYTSSHTLSSSLPRLARHPQTISIPHKQPTAIPLQRWIQPIQCLQTDPRLIRHILAVLAALLLDPLVTFTANSGLRLFRRRRAPRTRRIRRRGTGRDRRRRGADAVRVACEEA